MFVFTFQFALFGKLRGIISMLCNPNCNASLYIILVGGLVGCDHMLFRDLRLCGVLIVNVCVVINVAIIMLLWDFSPRAFYLYAGWWSCPLNGVRGSYALYVCCYKRCQGNVVKGF